MADSSRLDVEMSVQKAVPRKRGQMTRGTASVRTMIIDGKRRTAMFPDSLPQSFGERSRSKSPPRWNFCNVPQVVAGNTADSEEKREMAKERLLGYRDRQTGGIPGLGGGRRGEVRKSGPSQKAQKSSSLL